MSDNDYDRKIKAIFDGYILFIILGIIGLLSAIVLLFKLILMISIKNPYKGFFYLKNFSYI
jgi:hypothetical protein